MLTNTD